MHTLAFVNQKGGCGKTTVAVNLAGALAEQGQRVLLVDLDPQAHATMALSCAVEEGALLEHPAIQEAGVVGFHHLLHGENVRAYVTLRAGASRPTSQELIRFARERVGYKAPEEIVFLEEMPLNATGKVDRVTLKQMAADRHNSEHV